MTEPSTIQPIRARRGLSALLVLAACALACALPVIGSVLAGTFLDRVLDSPAWLAVLGAIAVGLVTMLLMRRRGKGGSDGC